MADLTGQTNSFPCGCGNCNECTENNTFTPGIMQEERLEQSTPMSIPAGAYYVDIRNTGLTTITVNGETVSPGGKWHGEQQINHTTKTQDFLPAVDINPGDSKYWVKTSFPSGSSSNNCGYSTGVQQGIRREQSIDQIIPAGAYYVDIRNTGLTTITVNGEPVSPGGEWHGEQQINIASRIQDFVGQINIQTPGGKYWFRASYPSGTNINI